MSQISRLQSYELFLTPTIPYKKYLAYHSDVVSDTMNYLNTLYRNNVFRDAEYATDSTMTMIKKIGSTLTAIVKGCGTALIIPDLSTEYLCAFFNFTI